MIPVLRDACLRAAIFGILMLPNGLRAQSQTLQPAEPSAGPGAVTLLVSNAVAQPFSLLNVRSVVAALLSRADTRIVTRDAGAVAADDLAEADYVVLLGIGEWPSLAWLETLRQSGKPVLAIGTAGRAFQKTSGTFPTNAFEATFVRSATLTRGPASFQTSLSSVVPATAVMPSEAETPATARWDGKTHPLAWRRGSWFWFSALPIEPATGFIFSDVLLDFYGVENAGASGVLCVLEDFHEGCDPASLRRAADLLAGENCPFAITIRLPEQVMEPGKAHAFVAALRYAQARGGRILLTRQNPAFWDVELDRPAPEAGIAAAVNTWKEDFDRSLLDELFVLGVRLPDSGFSAAAARLISGSFDLALGAAQASDATASATFSPGTVTQVEPGLLLLPMGLWFQPADSGSETVEMARNLLKLRGMILGVSIPAWQPFDRTEPALRALMDLDAPFLDLLEAPAAVSTGKALLMTQSAAPAHPRFSGKVQVRGFDRRAREIFLKTETLGADSAVFPFPASAEATFVVAEPVTP